MAHFIKIHAIKCIIYLSKKKNTVFFFLDHEDANFNFVYGYISTTINQAYFKN